MVGEFIVLRRKELGIRRKDLAENLGITYNYLNLIETNRRKVSKKLLPRLAEELQVSQEELKFFNEHKYGTEKKFIQRQIEGINKQLAKLEMDKILLEKERDFLCEKIVIIDKKSQEFGGNYVK